MPTTVNIYANKSAAVELFYPDRNVNPGRVYDFYGGNGSADRRGYLLVGYAAPPDAYQFRRIISVTPFLYQYWGSSSQKIVASLLDDEFDASTVTFNTMPTTGAYSYATSSGKGSGSGGAYIPYYPFDFGLHALQAIKYGLSFEDPVGRSVDTSYGTHKPYLAVSFDDDDVVPTLYSNPASGYVDRSKAVTFNWLPGSSEECFGVFEITNAVFKINNSGSISEYQCGTNASITIPAGTLPLGSFSWQAVVTFNSGDVVETPWYNLTTSEILSTAIPLEPIDTIVDGSKPVTFAWRHSISTGTKATGADVQQSSDGSTWADVGSVSGSISSLTVAADTLPGGQLYWRVRTYNSQNLAGEWSEPVNIIVVAAPPMPSVSAEQTPRPLITWQAEGQQAYEVTIGDNVYSDFGTMKEFKAPFYLRDGTYTVSVRVQNSFGLWSAAGSTQIAVSNSPGEAITLTVTPGYEANLSWETDGDYERYVVLRDGIPIAMTSDNTYSDRLSYGFVKYTVYGVLSNSDNYTPSNNQSVTIASDVTMLLDIETGSWIELRLTDEQFGAKNISLSATGYYRHFTHSAYPSVETSKYRDRSLDLSVSVLDDSEGAQIEALLGKMVCVKHKGGMTIGALLSLSKTVTNFYLTYTLTIRQANIEEVLEL